MFLEELRMANMTRLSKFNHGDLVNGWNVAEWGCVAAGEMGELCNILKKMNRQMSSDPSCDHLREKASEEIADTVIYLDIIAAKLGLSLQACIRNKFNYTSEKHGFSEKLL